MFRWMEVYPEKMDDTYHIMRYAHDAVYRPFHREIHMYLNPSKNYYSQSFNNLINSSF